MTVEELIKELEKMPKDALVIIVDPTLYGSRIKKVAINDNHLGQGKVKIYSWVKQTYIRYSIGECKDYEEPVEE